MKKDQFIITETVVTAGCISYFRCASDTSLDNLAKNWAAQGLAADKLPKPPEDGVALGRAVNAQAEKRRLVRPLARRGVWAIVEETVKEGAAPTYRTLVTVAMLQGDANITCVDASDAELYKLRSDIAVAYSDAQNFLAHSDISAWLIKMAYGLGAVSLRESGGVYFIPRSNVDIWMKVAAAVDASGSSVFTIPAMRTAEAVAAITDAITQEAEAEMTKVYVELAKQGEEALGKRALKTRTETAEALLAKLASYEELLGKQLAVRTRVEELQTAIVAVALTHMGSESEAA